MRVGNGGSERTAGHLHRSGELYSFQKQSSLLAEPPKTNITPISRSPLLNRVGKRTEY